MWHLSTVYSQKYTQERTPYSQLKQLVLPLHGSLTVESTTHLADYIVLLNKHLVVETRSTESHCSSCRYIHTYSIISRTLIQERFVTAEAMHWGGGWDARGGGNRSATQPDM